VLRIEFSGGKQFSAPDATIGTGPKSPISCGYKTLNKPLRTQNMRTELLKKMAFFVSKSNLIVSNRIKMNNLVYNFKLDIDWKLINLISEKDRFDANWKAIVRK
jgi:hypothetical protein